MTRKEVKLLMPVLQAFAEGKTLQIRKLDEETWYDTTKDNLNFNLYNYDYRVKPELKYRPFKDVKECWKEMLKHQPLGWIRSITSEYLGTISVISNEEGDKYPITAYGTVWSLTSLFKNYCFADGTPFGIIEEG